MGAGCSGTRPEQGNKKSKIINNKTKAAPKHTEDPKVSRQYCVAGVSIGELVLGQWLAAMKNWPAQDPVRS